MIALLLALCVPLQWVPHEGKAFDGSPLKGERTFVQVPADPARPDGPQLELCVVRYRTRNPNPAPPIFFLAGGPGGSGVDLCASPATHPQLRLLEHADVIGIDQRGTGRSRPNLMEPGFPLELDPEQPLTRTRHLQALQAAGAACLAHHREQGVELATFTTANSAADFEAVRKALGLEQIVLYGGSYGSHLGLAYLRAFPERVARAIFTSVEGPDDTWKRPADTQTMLHKLLQRLDDSPAWRPHAPNLPHLLQRLQTHPRGPSGFPLSPYDLQLHIARSLSTSDALVALPQQLHQMHANDWRTLDAIAAAERAAEVIALPLLMDCASGGSTARLGELEQQSRDPANLLGDALLAPLYPEMCSTCPTFSPPQHDPFACDVPVLLVSGTHDVRTPPANAERLLPHFSRAVHVVVHEAGHEGRGLMSSEYRDLLQRFLRGEALQSCEILLPPPILPPPLPPDSIDAARPSGDTAAE